MYTLTHQQNLSYIHLNRRFALRIKTNSLRLEFIYLKDNVYRVLSRLLMGLHKTRINVSISIEISAY